MSEIVKTEAIVLGKINYGDTSSVTSLFTRDMGKLSAIVKGGRNPKSKLSNIIDPLNLVNVVFYNKSNRELQLLTSVDLISHYPVVKNNLDKLKYCYSILELVKHLIPEHEENLKLFKGINRIMELFEASAENEKILFGRFFIFFIELLGYELPLEKCSNCGKTITNNGNLGYTAQFSILCSNCTSLQQTNYLNPELFLYLRSLKFNQKTVSGEKIYDSAILFLEQYLKYHVPVFQGLQSLKMFK